MPTTITASATNDTLEPNKAQRVFRASNGDLIVVWSEPTSPYVRRSVSTDNGVTWTRKDPTSLTFTTRTVQVTPNLLMCASGDTIYGFNFDYATASSAQMFKFAYATTTRTFTDSIASYTWTSAPIGNKATEDGEARYDPIRQTIHVCFTAINSSPAGAMWLIAFSTALAKITELNFATGGGSTSGSMRLDQAASPKVYLGYEGGGSLKYRSYTWNGATYVAADAEETVLVVSSGSAAITLDASSLVDFFWYDGAGNLQTRKRTGVTTYSAITTLATDAVITAVNSGRSASENIAVAETGNINADLWVFYKSVATYDTGELRYVRRNNAAWSASALLSGGSAAGRNGPCPIALVQLDGYIHILYGAGNDISGAAVWTLLYDKLATGQPSGSTTTTPSTRGETSLTPTITGTYLNNRTADNLGKYRILVRRSSDGTVMWDTGISGTAWGGAAVAPGGTFSVVYAGSALTRGVDYDTQISCWDTNEVYVGTETFSTVFTETFASTAAWVAQTGVLGTVAGGILTAGSTGTWRAVLAAPFKRSDGRWSAHVKAVTTGDFFAVEKYADVNNQVQAFLDGGGNLFQLRKNVGGVATTVKSISFATTLNLWYFLEVETRGNIAVARVYETTVAATTKQQALNNSTGRYAVVSGSITDAGVAAGSISLLSGSVGVASQWGGPAASPGGAYVEEPTIDATFAVNLPPVLAAASITADATNGRNRMALYPLAPSSGTSVAAATAAIMRRIGAAAFAAIKSALAFTAATTQTGFAAYRQLPTGGLLRNLAINGGYLVGTHGWQFGIAGSTNVGTAVADPLSPTGYALRAVTSVANQNFGTQFVNVEPGRAYSLALQARTDGVAPLNFYMQWLDVAGNTISQVHVDTSSTVYVELNLTNQVAPGNARQLALIPFNPTTAGILFVTAIRLMQQTTAPAAWSTATHQQYRAQGIELYEAGTNSAADGDMEAVGTASYGSTNATLTKDTVTFFAGAKALKAVATANGGFASQTGALATGQPITASVRCKPGGVTSGLKLLSTPSNAVIGTSIAGAAGDWQAIRVSGVIAGADTGWQVQLIAGANTETSYFDNLAVENKAYDTMNADASGQAFALAARTVSALVIPVPAALVSTSDVTMLAVVRCDAANATRNSEALSLQIDGNNFVTLTINGTQPQAQRDRAGTLVTTVVGGAIANGDTVSMAVRWRVGVGLSLYWAANGGAVTQVDVTTEESKLAPVGTPTGIRVGGSGGSLSIDGTVGIVRVLASGLSDAAISAFVSNPYQDPTTNDLAVWGFDGATYQVPTYNDRLIKLGTAYDYRVDTTAAAATPTSSTGQVESATLAWDPTTLWWLKAATTESLDTQLDVIDSAPFTIPRTAGVLEPINSSRKVVQRSAQAFGDELHLHAFHRTLAEQVARIASLRALQASNEQLYAQDPFGNLRAVTIVGGIALDPKDNTLGVDLDLIETA